MNGYRAGALACLGAAVGLLAYGASTGDVRAGFFFIVPFISGTGLVPLAAMLLLLAAFVLWSLGSMRAWQHEAAPEMDNAERLRRADSSEGRGARTRSGGVVLLGPIPIVWGSDRRILPWMVAAGFALLLLGLWLTR